MTAKKQTKLAMDVLLDVIKAKSADRHAQLKQASIGDTVKDDGLQAAKPGAQMAFNKSVAGEYSDAMVDGKSKDSPAGASVENSPSTLNLGTPTVDGQKGANGGENDNQAPNKVVNGSKGMLTPQAKTAAELRAVADEFVKIAEARQASVTGMRAFVAGQYKADPALAKVAADAGMDDAGMADQGVDALMQQIQSGQLSEEDAEKILMEALQSGAISQEDLVKAMNELHAAGGPGDPAAQQPPAGDAGPAGGPAPAPAPGPAPEGAPAPAGPGEMVEDPSMEAKMASVDIQPGHPMYASKLELLYGDEVRAGEDYCLKVAAHLGFIKRADPLIMPKGPNPNTEAPKDEAKGSATVDNNLEGTPAKVMAKKTLETDQGNYPKLPSDEAVKTAAAQLGIGADVAAALMASPAPKIASEEDRAVLELVTRLAFKK